MHHTLLVQQSRQVVNTARKPPKSKQEFFKLAQNLLRLRRRSTQLVAKEPPASILEADLTGLDSKSGEGLPTEFVYMLRYDNSNCGRGYSP